MIWTCVACASSEQARPDTPSRTSGACSPREPEAVALVGVVERVTFPGPPNYESVALGDAEETCWVLKLERPICLDALRTASGAVDDEKHSGVDTLQLVFADGRPYVEYRALVGQRVRATGSLFGAQTGHHHTEVLLTVRDLTVNRRQ